MDKRNRKRIGLLLEYRGNWLGGVYYILNIIKALNHLDDEEKPELVIFYDDNSKQFLDLINYPYLNKVHITFDNQYGDYIKSWVSRKDFFLDRLLQEDLDGLFPVNDMPVEANHNGTIVVSWFPDLQHKFHPEYFSKTNLILREMRLKLLLKNGKNLVVSSEDTKRHFEKFYNIQSAFNFKVLPFVSMLDDFQIPAFSTILEKYKIPKKFFVVSNQFYEHKNHITVLKSLKLLKEKGEEITVVFTGRMEDHRNPGYIDKLKNYIEKNNLESSALFVGLIPRADQLSLLKNAVAVIQPSLFEGWSTLVEDAKALKLQIIVSDIDVHIEQLGEKGCFFKKDDDQDLAAKILNYWNGTIEQHDIFNSYTAHIRAFGNKFLSIFSTEKKSTEQAHISQFVKKVKLINSKTSQDQYNNDWFHPGGSYLKRVIWFLVNGMFLINPLNPFSGIKVFLLRLFGAEIGDNVLIKPSVNIKYPWHLKIGNHVWIGEKVWIDNLTKVTIGDHVCVSQGAMLLTGNHNYKKPTFDLIVGEITLEEGVWISAQSTVCSGVTCRSHSVLGVNSVATKDLEPYQIYVGNPCEKIRERIIE